MSLKAIKLPPEAKILSPSTKKIVGRTVELNPGETIEIEVPRGKLSLFNPLEGLLITFKLSIWTGCLASSPLWLYFLLQFLLPALKRNEKRLVLPFLTLSTLFTAGGIALCLFGNTSCHNGLFYPFQ